MIPNQNSQELTILCLGQRGAGKTMFLVGGYVQGENRSPGQVWLDGQDSQSQEKLKRLAHLVSSGQLPSTSQATEFRLNLKQRRQRDETICRFRWWELPGGNSPSEYPEQALVMAQRYCVFMNAYALINDRNYRQELEKTLGLAVAMAALNKQLVTPRFALILTQCDHLATDAVARLQIEEQLAPLLEPLRLINAEYRKFYTASIVNAQVTPGSESTEVLLWLAERRASPSFASRRWSQAAALTLASAGALAALAASNLGGALHHLEDPAPEQRYQQVLQIDPRNVEALTNLAALYLERGQIEEAIPVMEEIVQQQPKNIEARLSLAKGYETDGQSSKAEAVYDSVLTEQENNLSALLGKALLLSQRGKTQKAKTVFAEAEAAALSSEIKQKVRLIAQKALSSN